MTTRRFITLAIAMLISASVHAQTPPMPHAVMVSNVKVVPHTCTNCPPPKPLQNIELEWTPLSFTWEIVEQILYRSTNYPFHWSAYRFFDDGMISNCTVPCTNSVMGFFWISSIDKNGFMWSPPP